MAGIEMLHSVEPRDELVDKLGDVSGFDIFHNQVLAAVYIRPERTKSGLYLAESTRQEDRFQGKVGLVVKLGPAAFKDDTGKWFQHVAVGLDDWIVFRPSDGWSITVNGILCRIIDDTSIRGKIDRPDRVW